MLLPTITKHPTPAPKIWELKRLTSSGRHQGSEGAFEGQDARGQGLEAHEALGRLAAGKGAHARHRSWSPALSCSPVMPENAMAADRSAAHRTSMLPC
jgi:hypothetical protein